MSPVESDGDEPTSMSMDKFFGLVKFPAYWNACWLWEGKLTGGLSGKTYGYFNNGTAHRAVYVFAYGPIPPRMTIDHLCRNTKCVNPLHLEAVTHRENCRRRDVYLKEYYKKNSSNSWTSTIEGRWS